MSIRPTNTTNIANSSVSISSKLAQLTSLAFLQEKYVNTTTLNQVLGLPGLFSTYTPRQSRSLRIIAICASCVSSFVGFIAVFSILCLDRRKKLFRHDLILFLMCCDILKAIVLMLYPAIIVAKGSVYGTPTFFNILGWFTAFSIEGSDIAIMFFAIHFALLIFKPTWRWRNKRTGNMEGGLYRFRRFILPVTFIFPSVLASLAFINYNVLDVNMVRDDVRVVQDNNEFDFPFEPRMGGYKPWSAWCYLPPEPLWYKFALSWGPRYVLIFTILGIYFAIFFYVSHQNKQIRKQIEEFRSGVDGSESKPQKSLLQRVEHVLWLLISPFAKFMDALGGLFRLSLENTDPDALETGDSFSLRASVASQGSQRIPDGERNSVSLSGNLGSNLVPMRTRSEVLKPQLTFPQESRHRTHSQPLEEIETSAHHAAGQALPEETQEDILRNVRLRFQEATYYSMKKRRIQIQRNMRTIFIYPCSYILLWLFPILADCYQIHREIVHGPIMWLSSIVAFVRPMNSFVDSFVFIFKERPWRLSWHVVEREILRDQYRLEGRIPEVEMLELCNSKWGRRGWYCRGMWNKRYCWKHKSSALKRNLWYVGRFFEGLFRGCKFDFYDNCDDENYWRDYYFVETHSQRCTDRFGNAQFSGKGDNRRCSEFSKDSSLEHQNLEDVIEIPWYWRLVHKIPLLSGVDLDDLNRELNLAHQQTTHFVVPTFSFAPSGGSRHSLVASPSMPVSDGGIDPFTIGGYQETRENYNGGTPDNGVGPFDPSRGDLDLLEAPSLAGYEGPSSGPADLQDPGTVDISSNAADSNSGGAPTHDDAVSEETQMDLLDFLSRPPR